MKQVIYMFGMLCLIGWLIYMIGIALEMVSAKSDLAVVGGVALLFWSVAMFAIAVKHIGKDLLK